jgi:hypothetical protein
VASRLHSATRWLDLQVTRTLDQFGPATAMPIALYVAGVILLDAHLLTDNCDYLGRWW